MMSPSETLAWSLWDNSIQLIRLSDQEVLATLVGHPDPVLDLIFSPIGDELFSASHDGVVRIWDLSGKPLTSIKVGGEVLGMGVSLDGSKLATIQADGPVQVWDPVSGQKVAELGGSGVSDTSDAHFSPDGEYLAVDLASGLILWRVADGELLWDGVKNSMAITFSPDGRYVAYSDVDDGNKVVLASPDAASVVRIFSMMEGPVWEMFFSPDGSLLAATDGIQIRIWRVEDGRMLYVGKSSCQ